MPNYQRDYAWKDKNFRDLWEDLEEAIEYNKKLYDIIDGQQRTTTIFMLLHVLANEQNEKDKQETRKYLYQKGELKLEVAPQNQSFFKALLEAAEKRNISHCEKDADTEGKQNLFEILKAILKKGQGHFIDTMVVAKNEDNKKLYDIIDGQQRTTTIFMLLHVLANEQNEKDKQETRKYLYQKGELKLEVAPQNQSFFKALLEAAEKRNISHCEKDADTEASKISLRF
ncbi:DUF262 domain-containing protein [Helicobacter pylori]|nr:DUF262 domain-containing protein [Helicobacter pylori]